VPTDPNPVTAELDALYARLEHTAATKVGFPDASDIDYSALDRFSRFLLNNIGDPATDGAYPHHTKPMEREVVTTIADLLRAPADDRWGYVTSGATEGSEYALLVARRRYPDAIVYHSEAAHFADIGIFERLCLNDRITIRCDDTEEMIYQDLARQVDRRRDRPAIVIANAGTGWHEAVDDVRQITAVLDEAAVRRRFIHVDAALSGVPLATIEPDQRPGFDFADGADSVIVSGHKFLGTPMPCGVVIVKASHRGYPGAVTYTGSADTTISNSRNGHAALALWYALRTVGIEGLAQRARHARELAAFTQQRLTGIGWPATHHPHAMTVAIPTPPAVMTTTWALPDHEGQSRIVCVPGMTRTQIDTLVSDLTTWVAVDRPATTVDGAQPESPPSEGLNPRRHCDRAPIPVP